MDCHHCYCELDYDKFSVVSLSAVLLELQRCVMLTFIALVTWQVQPSPKDDVSLLIKNTLHKHSVFFAHKCTATSKHWEFPAFEVCPTPTHSCN